MSRAAADKWHLALTSEETEVLNRRLDFLEGFELEANRPLSTVSLHDLAADALKVITAEIRKSDQGFGVSYSGRQLADRRVLYRLRRTLSRKIAVARAEMLTLIGR